MNPLNWSLVTPYSIQLPGNTFYSGRTMDALLYKNAVVVATAKGGIWAVNKDVTILDGYQTTSLADLPDPDTQCLANGPGGEAQVYVGCSQTLYYLELAMGMHGPEASFVASIPFPALVAPTFYRIVVQKAERRIVVATSTGVWWSSIPQHPRHVSGYQWQPAMGLPAGPVAGLCTRTGSNVHAAMWGSGSPADDAFGIFRGTFKNNELTFERSALVWTPGDDVHHMVRVSLASCASRPDRAYAVCCDNQHRNPFHAILEYSESMDQWTVMKNNAQLLALKPGEQGWFNNCVAVAPDDPDLVAFGWQTGTFVQVKDHGNLVWKKLESPKTHADMHGLLFVQTGQGEHTLYVSGDGGVLEVRHPKNATPEFSDKLNVFLPTLLFRDYALHYHYGTTDVSGTDDGLISGGLQDNGVKYLKTTAGGYASWKYLDGGDGGTSEFLTNGVLLFRESNKNNLFRWSRWDSQSNAFTPSVVIPTDVPIDDEDKHRMWFCSRVIAPAFRNASNQLMHAVSAAVRLEDDGTEGDDVVLGLFSDEAFSKPHWQVIGKPGAHVSAVASMSGSVVFVGLTTGDLLMLNPATPTVTPPPITLPVSGGLIVQFEVVSASLVFALHTTKKKGALLVYDGLDWKIVPLPVAEIVSSIAVDWAHKTLFLVTDTSVYRGVQDPVPAGPHTPGFQTSFSWTNESSGLPMRPHGTHLRIGMDDGETFLYLSTYGRSVYRALLADAAPARPGEGEAAAVQVLFGVIQDGGGAEVDPNSGKITIVPPRQPVEVALASLLKSERLIGVEKKADERRAALEAVRAFVDRELQASAR